MKISLNWLKKYVDIPDSVSNDELVRLIGARLVEVEGVIDETHKYDNIYIVQVEKCEKIPDTHLTLCKVNAGSKVSRDDAERDSSRGAAEVATERARGATPVTTGGRDIVPERTPSTSIQVVCGAPNVREGMLAVWIAPGAIAPASVHEDAPFVIGKRKMQGYESCGMLASANELDFGDDHSGIVEIDPEMAQPGDLLADVFELNDLILDIENKSLTHRPDCFGIIGFAREVAGILGRQFGNDFSRAGVAPARRYGRSAPSTSVVTSGHPRKIYSELTPKISISQNNICPRYTALVLEKHGELKKKYLTLVDTLLSKSGMKPISPIVDATNYLMLLTGQPLHAFDYDKFVEVGKSEKAEIVVRLAKDGETLTLLDDKEVRLNENDILICSGKVPVALAGAMGGKSTMIDENTKNIILESATFSLFNLRKTQMAHGIFSEAITRFTKGQSPNQTLDVARVCAKMLSDGFKVVAEVDEYPKPKDDGAVKITTEEINGLLGTKYDEKLIIRTLENVGFDIKKKKLELAVKAPEWRMDIHIKEDIIEEVGRLLGYDNIPVTLPLHATAGQNKVWELKKQIRDVLARFGANEVLTYSFVSERLLDKVGQKKTESYKIVNSISPELQFIRQSIVPSLLEKAYLNEKLPVEKIAIFEMNKVYNKTWGGDPVPNEMNSLGFVVAERKNTETAYYRAKLYLAKLLEELGIEAEFLPSKCSDGAWQPFEPKRSADILVDGDVIGVVGEFKNSVKQEFKLAPYAAGFEIVDLEKILDKMGGRKTINFGKKKKEDVTITTNKSYAETIKEVQEKYPDAKITPGVIYQAKGQKTKNMTFHVEL